MKAPKSKKTHLEYRKKNFGALMRRFFRRVDIDVYCTKMEHFNWTEEQRDSFLKGEKLRFLTASCCFKREMFCTSALLTVGVGAGAALAGRQLLLHGPACEIVLCWNS